MFILQAEKNKLVVQAREAMTSGSVNTYTVLFKFPPDWDDMEKTALLKARGETFPILLGDDSQCIIPWEVLSKPGVMVEAGVYGTRDGEIVLPTIWCSLGTILEGATLGDKAQPPTPGVYEQILDELANKADGLEYDGTTLSLKAGNKPLSTVQITGGSGEGGTVYQFGHGLKLTGNTVSVDTVSDFAGDNTLPMTAAGVQTTVGNIEALLGTI